MKISLNWLSDFIDITEKDPQKISDTLTERAAEVDGFESQEERFKGIVIGEILEIFPHPNADKLQIADVKVDNDIIQRIVCGAKNIKAGQKVPVALIGTKIGDFTIEKRKIRGEESNGMMCSQKELEIGENHEGIYILPNDLKVGESFAKTMGYDDTIFEIDNTAITNRPDLFSQFGFAREFVALGLGKWKKGKNTYISELEKLKDKAPKNRLSFDLNIVDSDLCPRWCGIEVENVEIKESPIWIQQRLNSVGIRPISNVVDITNYVMLELGMPMHAFDRDKINGKKLVMRNSKKGEKMSTLDKKIHSLPENTIIMEDEKEIFDLCGLMGGESSAISDSTKNLLIHAPVYHPIKIRKAALHLNHRTDAAVIYEKGVPESVALAGLMLTVKLVLDLCPNAKIATSAEDKWPNKNKKKEVKLNRDLIERIIGKDIGNKNIEKILLSLDFETKNNSEGWNVNIPSHRFADINIPEDLAEEVARIYGFNKVEAVPPQIFLSANQVDKTKILKRKISDLLVSNNFCEVLNFSFLGPKLLERSKMNVSDKAIEVKNPLSSDQSIMRESLLPRLLETAEKNSRYFEKFRIFEIGKVFQKTKESKEESEHLAGILIGEDFFTAKGVVEMLFDSLALKPVFKKSENKKVDVFVHNINIGSIEQINSKITKEFSLPNENSFFSINLEKIKEINLPIKKFEKLPKYPSINFDVSVLAPIELPAEDILKVVQKLDKLIVKSEIIEIFTGKGIPEDQKSVTLSFEFRSPNRTLEESDAKELDNKIIKKLEQNKLKKRFE